MRKFWIPLSLGAIVLMGTTACEKDDDSDKDNQNNVIAPATYTFERDGSSTVSYSGQTERLAMGGELSSAFKNTTKSETDLMHMYANEDASGNNVDPFSDPALNASSKSLRSKTAASFAYFSSNASESAAIKEDFENWITLQVNEVFPAWSQAAAAGVPGQIADGSSARYVNAQGLEYDQAFLKSLMGACIADQMLNNYLDEGVLDGGNNREENDNGTTVDGKSYTNMEHKWDEAYGYLFGGAANGADPLATLGNDDAFLNKYLGRVNGDADFAGIAEEIYNALKLGRAAIVAKNYTVRDQQADIVRAKISEMLAIRAVYYLQAGKNAINNGNMGTAFHDLSEGYGFIYSLRFTHNPETGNPYFSATEVSGFLGSLMAGGANGFWDLTPATIDQISNTIAGRFNFTVAQAAN